MIVTLSPSLSAEQVDQLAATHQGIALQDQGNTVLVLSAKVKELPAGLAEHAVSHVVTDTDIQLGSRAYRPETRTLSWGNVTIGGNTGNTVMMAGPCSVESEEQITQVAEFLKGLGITTLRAGCFKPRTSPYTFRGLGMEGLRLLGKMRDQYGFTIITEVRDASHVDAVIEHSDIVQVGAKAMYDHGILQKCGESRKPVLLKRSFGATLQEFAQMADFVLSLGNDQVMLCERGIRTFEHNTRFTLDLTGVAWLKKTTNLPVILDPSHAMGYAYGVPDLARACAAMGVDGLLIESHPNPKVAMSDAAQQLDFPTFEAMYKTLPPILGAIGRQLV